jgi:hypothetical protein
VNRIGVEVEIATEVEREVVGVVKESSGSYNGVLLSYLHVPWFVADCLEGPLWPGILPRTQNNDEKRLTSRLCKNHTFDLTRVTTVTEVNLASHWPNPGMFDVTVT